MLRVGLTGGIACGKSHVLRGLARAGIATLDLDEIAHELLQQRGQAYAAVVAAFGVGILDADGAIDRHLLGERVFREPAARARLNAIVHPHIREEEERRTRAAAAVSGLVVVDGALLVEAGGHLRFDRLIVAHCSEDQQIERLQRRDRLARDEALRRVAAQMPTAEKRRFASLEVDTGGASEATDAQIAALPAILRELAARQYVRPRVSARQVAGCLVHGPALGVRGLAPQQVLAAVAAAGTIDLADLARRFDAGGARAWYDLAAPTTRDDGAEALSAVAALWVIARRGADREAAVAAAASLARLTHRGGEAIAGACLLADALAEVAVSGAVAADWRRACVAWAARARKWDAASAPARVIAAVEAAARAPRDLEAARQECRGLGGDMGVCGALVGLAVGCGDLVEIAPEVLVACQRLGFAE